MRISDWSSDVCSSDLSDLKDDDRKLLKPYFLLTNRAVMALVNVSEDQLDDIDAVTAPVAAELAGKAEVIGMCVQLEAEAAMLDADGRVSMPEGLRLGRGAHPRFLHPPYKPPRMPTIPPTPPQHNP